MNNTKSKMSDSVFNKIVAVVTALSLIFLQVPISSMTAGARADAANTAKEQLAGRSTVDIPLKFEHAFIVYDDQTIAEPATKVTLPSETAMKFKAEADNGYQLESVKATVDGTETELEANKQGEYKLTADEVAATSKIVVRAITAPTVEDVEVAPAEEAEEAEEPAAEAEKPASAEPSASEAAETPEATEADEARSDDKGASAIDAASEAAPAAEQEAAPSDDSSSAAAESAEADSASAASSAQPAASDETATANAQTEFTYEDSDAQVTATLSRADAIPAGAQFQVTRVTPTSDGYNYNAYLEALNTNVGAEEYTSENTLLYDVAFMVKNADGKLVEYEPESGTVAISIRFKNDQLSDGISAADSSEIEVKHLPLKGNVRDGIDSTADATNISSTDIVVEDAREVSANVDGEAVDFTLESLSITAVSNRAAGAKGSSATAAITSNNAAVSLAVYPSAGDRSNKTNPLTNDYEISLSQTLYGAVNFDFKPGEGPTTDRLVYSYTLPDNIVAENKPAATLYDDSGNVAGTWEIQGNIVNFYYNEDWALSHPNSGGHFNFDFTLDESKVDSGQDASFNFPGVSNTITVKVKDAEMTGSKWNSGVVDGVVTYTVQLNAETDFNPFVFSDVLQKNLDYVEGSFKLDGRPFNVTVRGNSDGSHTATSGSQSISKGTHTITYQAKIKQSAYDALKNWESVSYNKNTATWTYTKDGKTKSGSASSTVWVQKQIVAKWNSGLSNGNKIRWNIEVNGGRQMKFDVGGYTVTDVLKSGQTYGYEFIVYDKDWHVYDRGSIPSGSTSFSYTFPQDAGSSVYYVSYSATIPDTTVAGTYTNTATVTPPDSGKPGGSSTGTFTYNPDANQGEEQQGVTFDLLKETSDESKKATTGDVTWHSKISSDSLSSYRDATGYSLEYFDTLEEWNNITWDSYNGTALYYKIWFTGEPTLYANGTQLVKGEDYFFEVGNAENPAQYGYTAFNRNFAGESVPTAFRIRFNESSQKMKDLLKASNPSIDVYYNTKSDGTYQTFNNKGEVDLFSGEWVVFKKEATASYTIDGIAPVTKKGLECDWDNNLKRYVASWEVIANRSGDDWNTVLKDLQSPYITMTDVLPEGMTVVEDSVSVMALRPNGTDGKSYIRAYPSCTVTQTGNVATFKFNLNEVSLESWQQPFYDPQTGRCFAWFDITFDTALDPAYVVHDGSTQVLNNTATIESGGIPLGTGHGSVSYSDTVISKTGSQEDGAPVVHYTIKVNEKEQKLDPDETHTKVNLNDTLDYRTTVVLSSIKVTDGSGNNVTDQCTVKLDNNVTDGQGHATSAFTISVPDSTALTIEYDVRLSGTNGQYYQITNEASLSGIASNSTSSQQWFKVNHAEAGVYGNGSVISITKSDSSNVLANSARLSGAEFALYKVDLSKLPSGNYTNEGLAAASALVNTVTTGANGEAMLFEQSSNTIQYDTLYYFIETKAPLGYAIDDTSPHFVMVQGNNYDSQSAAAAAHGIVPSPNTAYNVTDTLKTSALLKAKKTFENGVLAGDDFTFELREGDNLIETVTNDAEGNVVFSNIEYDAAGTHHYTISEVAGDKGYVTYDGNVADVVVTVVNAGNGRYTATAEYEGGAEEASFTNAYGATGTAKLAATKTLNGSAPEAGEFSFTLSGPDGDIQTVSNDKNGKVTFNDITYNAADLTFDGVDESGKRYAEFTYTIKENVPAGAKTVLGGKALANGTFYDATAHTVTVRVTDTGSGALDVTYDGDTTFAGASFANTHETVGISGQKVWTDGDNQDGIRPESVTVQLLANGQVTDKTTTATAANGWTFSFSGLDKVDENVNAITYTVDEAAVNGYQKAVTGSMSEGFTVTNTHTPETTEIDVNKIWDDANNQDNIRKTQVYAQLYADGQKAHGPNGQELKVKLSEANGWSNKFTDLPKYKNGKEIVYTVKESTTIDGYTKSVTGNAEVGFTITNKHTPETTTVSGTKSWSDFDDAYKDRPTSVTVHLLADGQEIATTTATEAGGWYYEFKNLPVYKVGAVGQKVTYTVAESDFTDYDSSVSDGDLLNTFNPELTSVKVTKLWDDANDEDGVRPSSVYVVLYLNGNYYRLAELTAASGWTHTWTDLPKRYNGEDAVYSVVEYPVDGYDSSEVAGDASKGFTITNKRTVIPSTQLTITKTSKTNDWARLAGAKFTLTPVDPAGDSRTFTTGSDGTVTFDKLKKGATYTLQETTPPGGYELGDTVYRLSVSDDDNLTITCTEGGLEISGDKASGFMATVEDQPDGDFGSIVLHKNVYGAEGLWANATQHPEINTVRDNIKVRVENVETGDYLEFTGIGRAVNYRRNVDLFNSSGQRIGQVQVVPSNSFDSTINNLPSGTWKVTELADGLTDFSGANAAKSGVGDTFVRTTTYSVNGDTTQLIGTSSSNPQVLTIDDTYYNKGSLVLTKEFGWDYTGIPGGYAGNQLGEAATNTILAGIAFTLTGQNTGEVYTITGNGFTSKQVTSASGNTTVNVGYYNRQWTITNLPYDTYTVVETTDGYCDETSEPDTILHKFYTTGTFTVSPGSSPTNVAVDGTTGTRGEGGVSEEGAVVDVNGTDAKMNVLDVYYRPKAVEVTKAWTIPEGLSYTPGDIEVQLVRSINGVDNNGTAEQGYYYPVTSEDVPEHPGYVTRKTLHWDSATNSYDTAYFTNLPAVTANGEQITYEVREVSADGSLVPFVNGLYTDAEGNVLPEGSNTYIAADGATASVEKGATWTPGKQPYTEQDGTKQHYSSTKGLTLVNTIEATEVSGQKYWEDADDQDGKRPSSITVRLYANGEEVATKTVTAADGWAFKFTGMPKYKDGEEIVYEMKEDGIRGYDRTRVCRSGGVNFTITNFHTPEKTSVSGTKTWADNNDQDGKRPKSITVRLWKGTTEVASKTVKPAADGTWSYEFTGLDKYENGREITYTVTEDEVAGYTTAVSGTAITNTHIPETTSVSGSKTWSDANNQDGKRPQSITVNLLANGEKVDSKAVSANSDGTWSYEFDNLPKYKNGVEIGYSITEEPVADYTTTISGTNIVNSYETETTEVSGTKTWDDADNQDGKRPSSITVNLLANGEKVDSAIVTAANGWTYSFTNLPAYANGERITYSVTEDAVPGYTTVVSGYDIKNTHKPEETAVAGGKVWNDGDNQDGKRPKSITVRLLADGVEADSLTLAPDAEGNWPGFSFTKLPVYKNGKRITYSVTEDAVPGYETEVIASSLGAVVIKNKHVPETIQLNGEKVWDDADNQDGKRPTSVTVNLLANGEEVQEVVVSEAVKWKYSFTDLPKYEDGVEITYAITEDPVENYTTEIDGTNVKNTHVPEKTQVKIVKNWDDQGDYDGLRPNAVTAQLYADGVESGDAVTLDESNDWAYTWANLDKYAGGKEITYTVSETGNGNTAAYTTTEPAWDETLGAFVVTNKHVVEKVTVNGEKTWSDANDQDGKRPASITVNLLANGSKVAEKAVVPDYDGNWNFSFDNLDKYADGQEIVYTVTEGEVAGYTATITGSVADGFVINNAYQPEKTDIAVTKSWYDANNQDGIRPIAIPVRLMNGAAVAGTATLTAANNWTYTWKDLDRYANGALIDYTVVEDDVAGYVAELTGSVSGGFTLKNTHTPEVVDVSVDKRWSDADNQDGKRPPSIQVQLKAMANGEVVELSGVTTDVTLNEANNWHYDWADLPKKHGGVEITYSLEEVGNIDGYESSVTSSATEATETADASVSFTVTNTHVPEKTAVSGTKTWSDENNQDGMRPASITVRLWNGDDEVDSKTVTASDGWAYTFDNLPKYANGSEIVYAVTEDPVANYTTEINGTDVTNTHVPEKTSISGSKTWSDANDQDGKRPKSITVRVWNGDAEVASKSVKPDKDGNWSYEFTGLDKFANGEEIVYRVTEDEVAGYTTEVAGTNIANTHIPATTEISGSKTWNDSNNQDGKRPASITVNLLADGDQVDSLTLAPDAEGNWPGYTFTDLPVYKNGKKITYSVAEGEVVGYTTTYSGTDIVNSYETETTEISGKKIWEDGNDQDGMRPDSVTVHLLANGKEIDSTDVTSANGWAYSFSGLPVYESGKKISYTVYEDEVDHYTTTYSGNNVINTHIPETTDISGAKTWNDSNNQDGKRPASITVNLLADGDQVDSLTLAPDAEGNWPGYSFTDLPVYKNGEKIDYSITEDEVANYTTEVTGTNVANSHTPETVEVNGQKHWEDADDQDGKRPSSITVRLYANGDEVATKTVTAADGWAFKFTGMPKYKDGEEIVYEMKEDGIRGYDRTRVCRSGGVNFTITNFHTPEKTSAKVMKVWEDQDNYDGLRPNSIKVQLYANGQASGDAVELSAATGWSYSWSNLDKYAAGKEITYTVAEVDNGGSTAYTTAAPVYDAARKAFVITNTHEVVKVSVNGKKTWNDANNQDGKRPTSIVVDLLANGSKVAQKTVEPDASGNWTFEFSNLDKYKDGREITYTVAEEQVEGYTASITGSAAAGFAIENSYTPEETQVSVTKQWSDEDNQDGLRPGSVKVRLLANGEKVNAEGIEPEVDLNDGNGWAYTWTGLDRYANGKEIEYTVEEDAVADYTTEIAGSATGGYTLKNTHVPGLVDVRVNKDWNDANNQDGKRANSIGVELKATVNGAPIEIEGVTKTATLNEANSWHHEWKDLPQKRNGKVIAYSLVEVGSTDGYSTTVTSNQTAATATTNAVTTFTVTNDHTPELIDIPAVKAWNDTNNQDGKRPASITVQLFAGDEPVLVSGSPLTAELNADNNWSTSWDNLPKYANGEEIAYQVVETAVPADYENDANGTKDNGYVLTNDHETEKTSVSAKKVWYDADNQDGKRGTFVTVELYANGEKVQSGTLNADNNWFITWENLPKYANGEVIDYTLEEASASVPDGYRASVTKKVESDLTSFTVTNAHTPETVDVNGEKTWNDANDQDGKRPTSIQVNLLANGEKIDDLAVTPDEDGTWSYAFADLPKYQAGVEIVYTVSEEVVSDYTTVVSGYDITNSYKPGETNVKVTKAWDDADNQDGVRPTSVKVQLYADGVASGSAVELDESNSWTYTWEGLAQKAAGKDIVYTVAEVESDSWAANYTTAQTGNATDGYVITNTHKPEETTAQVTKVWNDADNQDGKRAESIAVQLLEDGSAYGAPVTLSEQNDWSFTWNKLPKKAAGKDIVYTLDEVSSTSGYTTEVASDGNVFTVTNKHDVELISIPVSKIWDDADNQDGKRPGEVTVKLMNGTAEVASLTLNAGNNWSGVFADLPKYDSGHEITYTLQEVEVSGYTSAIEGSRTEGFEVTNTHKPEETTAKVSKIWDDADNQDGKRPTQITVQLLANNGAYGAPITLSASNGWSYQWEGLPKFANQGQEISYTVTESGVPDDYTAKVEGDQATGYVATNSYTPGVRNVTVSKAWSDDDNRDGLRPEGITVRLLADNEKVDAEGVQAEVELNAGNNWTYTWTDLAQMRAGKEIVYSVEEVSVPEGYRATTAGNADEGYVITNTHTPERTSIEASKAWSDDDNRDGLRPEGVVLTLYANGKAVGEQTVTADSRGNWNYTFENLLKYENGVEIEYTISEAAVNNYRSEIDGFTATNSHDNEKVDVSGTKTWNDNDNQDGTRPSKITVRLHADGTEVDSQEVTAENNWAYSFTNLNKYRDGGIEIAYTVTEDAVTNYTTQVDGTNVVNTLEVGGLTVTKHVVNATTSKRFTFTVTLDDEKVNGQHGGMTFENGVATFTLADGESATAIDLPVGVGYTVAESDMAGYTTTMSGATGTVRAGVVAMATATNTYNATGTAQFSAMKTLDGRTLNADEFSFQLVEGGRVLQTVMNAGDGHADFAAINYTLADLGTHTYTIREVVGTKAGVTYDMAEHTFTTNVTDNGDGTLNVAYTGYNPATGVAFTNTYAPSGTVELEVNKLVDGQKPVDGVYTFRVAEGQMPAAGAFTFQLADAQGKVYATATNDEDGVVKFPALTFKAAGTYEYVITEVPPADAQSLNGVPVANGVAYDTREINVSIKAIDNFDGTMRFTTSYDGVSGDNVENAAFDNTSVPDAKYPLSAAKAIEGRSFQEGDSFTFTVSADDVAAPMPEHTRVTVDPTGGSTTPVNFGDITFTTDNLNKTYTYTISEANAGETVDGLKNDPFTHWVKLSVVDAGGKIGVNAEYQNNADGTVFTNTYTATGEAELRATKVLEGRDLADNEFFFKLSGDGLAADLTAHAAADGSVVFPKIPFTQADVGKDFHYTISEVKGTLGGVTYDESTHDVTVHVADNGDGTLAITYDYGEGSVTPPVFRNTYRAEDVSVQLTAHKALVGGTLAGGEFSFTLTGTSANAAGTSQTATNAADGTVAFDSIAYSAAGTYEYTVSEAIPADATDNGDGTFTGADGFIYDATEHTVVVTVTDDGAGKLVASVEYDGGAAAGISFGNTKLVRTGFEFNKYYFGDVGSFNFVLTAVDKNGVARPGDAVDYSDAATITDDGVKAFTATVQNGAFDGGVASIVFPEIAYPADGDYYYLVREADSGQAGVITDAAQYLAHVTVSGGEVTDTVFELVYNGENYGATTDLSFYNNKAVKLGFKSLSTKGYTAMAELTSVYPKAKKYLNGSTDQLVGGEFAFELVDDVSGTVIAQATNDENGDIAFFDEKTDPGLAYDKAGTYHYTIREVAGNEVGVVYDDSAIGLTVTVRQTDSGLVADTVYNGPGGAESAFYNVKNGMDITVQKVSRSGGEGLAGAVYALWMVGEGGDVLIAEATSDENGYITFKDVSILAGQKYYFKEVEAPAGHTVDPYRTAYFSLNAAGDKLVLVEKTASDGWHPATEVSR